MPNKRFESDGAFSAAPQPQRSAPLPFPPLYAHQCLRRFQMLAGRVNVLSPLLARTPAMSFPTVRRKKHATP